MKIAVYSLLSLAFAVLLVVGVGMYAKARWTISNLQTELKNAQASQKSLLEGTLNAVRTGDVHVKGKIEARDAVAISPQVEAPIKRLLVKEGQTVKAGQVLLELDPADLKVKLAESIKDQCEAQQHLDELERRHPQFDALNKQTIEQINLTYREKTEQFHADLEESTRDVAGRELDLKARQVDWTRAEKEREEGLTSQADAERAKLAVQQAQLAEAEAKANYTDLRRMVSINGKEVYEQERQAELTRTFALDRAAQEQLTDNDLAQARAALEECTLRVGICKRNLEAAKVRSTIRGIVTAASSSPRLAAIVGSERMGTGRALSFEELRETNKLIQPNDILFVIEGLDAAVVKVEVDEMDINRIKVGDSATITGVGFAGETLKGRVARISPKAKYVAEGITTFQTTIAILQPLGAARLGMSAEVEIQNGGES